MPPLLGSGAKWDNFVHTLRDEKPSSSMRKNRFLFRWQYMYPRSNQMACAQASRQL